MIQNKLWSIIQFCDFLVLIQLVIKIIIVGLRVVSFSLWGMEGIKGRMRGGKCWFAIESKSFEVSVEEVRGKLKGTIVDRSRGFSSWIRFGDLSLRNLLEGFEECCRKEKEGRLVKV